MSMGDTSGRKRGLHIVTVCLIGIVLKDPEAAYHRRTLSGLRSGIHFTVLSEICTVVSDLFHLGKYVYCLTYSGTAHGAIRRKNKRTKKRTGDLNGQQGIMDSYL